MSVAHTMSRLCSVKRDAVSPEVRRRELIELAAVVGLALVLQLSLKLAGSGALWPQLAVLTALPWGAAWTLRRTAGRQAAVAAAILSLGALGGLLLVSSESWVRELSTDAYVAVAIVWILATDRRASTGTVAFGATIMAAASALASLI